MSDNNLLKSIVNKVVLESLEGQADQSIKNFVSRYGHDEASAMIRRSPERVAYSIVKSTPDLSPDLKKDYGQLVLQKLRVLVA